MNCEQFQIELERAIDERQLSDRPSVSGHADSCESCRSAWQDFLLLESTLASWTEPVEVDLVDRIIAAARLESVPSPPGGEGARRAGEGEAQTGIGMPTTNRKTPSSGLRPPSPPRGEGTKSANRRRTWLTVATVAVVLLGAAVAFRPGPDQTADDDSPRPTPNHSPFEPDLNEDDQYAGVDELLASTRSAWEGIRSKAVNQASGLSVFVPDLNSDLGLPGPDSSTNPQEPSPKESPEEESLIPGELNRAFDFLLDVSEVTTT
jgi:hypothetical protein